MTIDQAQIDHALALIKKGSANADYFFEQLKSPKWIEPLAKKGLFAKPYDAMRRGDGVSFPFWGPGLYLARMAALPEAQAEVVKILKQLPPSDNPRVYEVVADAAAAVPPKLGKELVEQLLLGIGLSFQVLLPDKVGAVIVRLLEGGQVAEALRLTRVLLAIAPSLPPTEGEAADLRWHRREAKGRIDDWQYGKVLDQVLASLISVLGLEGFRMLCDLLEQAVAAGRIEVPEGPDDYSYIWRPAVERSEAHREDVRNALVSAVRDAGMQLMQASPQLLREIAEHLLARPSRIFHRLALFLARQYGESDIEVVKECLKRPPEWDDIGLHPEYELLLSHFFGRLAPEIQGEYLDWIERGPDGQVAPPAEVELRRNVWIRDHLGVLRAHLSQDNEVRLELLERIGAAREVGLPSYRVSVSWRGETSPLTEEETLTLAWQSLIGKIRDWNPPVQGDFDGPSVAGLANSIRQRVTADPHGAIEHLHEVVDVGPSYIAAILEALRDVIKKGGSVEWEPIIAFVERVVQLAGRASAESDRWQWTSQVAASLVEDSFDAVPAPVPLRLREQAWRILEQLAQHPDPTPDHESKYGGDNMDPATLSLNTVRGKTFHAIIRYALWWHRHLESLPDPGNRLERGFGELPEVRDVLDLHLDPEVEPALAVRAVYGQWFPWLALIDERWAREHVPVIFPEDLDETQLFWAAWGTYVVFCRPYSSVLEVLRPVYRRAIADAQDGMAVKVSMGERPSEHLAEHLMAYYWRGELSLDDDLVIAFFQSADGKLRGHALEWIGRTLTQLDEPVPPDAHQRLQDLWEWRISQESFEAEELQAFGWWFASERMEPSWSLQNLMTLLSGSVMPEPDHMVVERLVSIAESQPSEAVTCLDTMIELGREGWAIHGWNEHAKALLEAALRSSDMDAKERATRLIHRLGALGFRDFRALLQGMDAPRSDQPPQPH